jgi:isoleucine--tRNA ligase
LDDFNPNTDKVAYKDLEEIDKWALLRLEEVRTKVTEAYENYEFHVLYHAIHNFCTVDLSSIYLDILKDTMYAETATAPARRSAQTAIYEIVKTLMAMVTPVLSFTAEEVYQFLPKEEGMPESVMLLDWPQAKPEYVDRDLKDKWDALLVLRSELTKALELARQNKVIGHPLDAAVTVYANGEAYKTLSALGQDGLAKLLIVSEAAVVEGKDKAPADASFSEEVDIATHVVASPLEKCERCWIHKADVGNDADHPTLCGRCATVVKASR